MPALLAHAELGDSGGTGVGSLTLLDIALALLQLMCLFHCCVENLPSLLVPLVARPYAACPFNNEPH